MRHSEVESFVTATPKKRHGVTASYVPRTGPGLVGQNGHSARYLVVVVLKLEFEIATTRRQLMVGKTVRV